MSATALAHTLLEYVRRIGLKGTCIKRWQVRMLREKLLRIAAVLTRNTRRIKVLASSTTPTQQLFWLAANRLRQALE